MLDAANKLPGVEDFVHPDTHEKFWLLREQRQSINKKIDESRLDTTLQIQTIEKKIAEAAEPLKKAKDVIARLNLDAEVQERIAQLEDEKRNALLRQGDVERRMHLLDQFVVARVNAVSDGINGLFGKVKFKLFETNISNEGIRETCELMLDGRPYRNLSTSERHIAGMDIINGISSKLGIVVPVFVDNRESISELPAAPGQIINLIVSPVDKVLRVEEK